MNAIINCLDLLVAFLQKIIHPVGKVLNSISAILVGLMSIPIVIDVLSRVIFKKSVMGIFEMMEFCLVIIVFGALANGQIMKAHISIDFFVERLPQKAQDALDVFNYTLSVILFSLLTWRGIVQIGIKSGLNSKVFQLPISFFVGLATFGILIFTLVLFIDWLASISKLLKNKSYLGLILAVAFAVAIMMLPSILAMFSIKLSGLALGGLGFLVLLLLLFLKLPIATGMALVGIVGMLIVSRPSAAFGMFGAAPYTATASFMLVVVPLFVLMGELAFRSGISQDLFDTAYTWLGKQPGGLAMSSVAGCAGFAAVCGDSIATAVTMGTVALPEMKKKKYDPALATGCIAAGGTLGILIPPSTGFIFYAIVAEESIGKLFMAGILPGLMLAMMFMAYIFIVTKRRPELGPPGEASTFKEKLVSLKGVIGMLFLIVLILGGIMSGFFSPTEGGAVGAFGAFLIALVKRKLTVENLMASLKSTVAITCMLMFILVGVEILGYFLSATRLPFYLAEFVTGLPVGRYVILLAIVILYIILGCLMNVIPIILLTLPAIFPTVVSLGFDPIWFGVVTVLLMQMGQITPPIGICVFALRGVAKDVPVETIMKGIVPFFICMMLMVLLITIFPQIALFLPTLLM